jgi:hypothetical protein
MQLNDVELSDLKIGAIICICIGLGFLIVPEKLIKYVTKKLSGEDSSGESGGGALTSAAVAAAAAAASSQSQNSMVVGPAARRYKYSTPSSPNPNAVNNVMTTGKWIKHNSISSNIFVGK